MGKLKDKQYKTYNYLSRYASFPFYYNIKDNKYIYGTTSQLDTTVNYMEYKVETNDTLDSIALMFYNNPTFYWVISDFNRIQDPFKKLKVGTVLKIPTLSNIKFIET